MFTHGSSRSSNLITRRRLLVIVPCFLCWWVFVIWSDIRYLAFLHCTYHDNVFVEARSNYQSSGMHLPRVSTGNSQMLPDIDEVSTISNCVSSSMNISENSEIRTLIWHSLTMLFVPFSVKRDKHPKRPAKHALNSDVAVCSVPWSEFEEVMKYVRRIES